MKILKTVGKVFSFVLVTLVALVLAALIIVFIFEKGPSETAKIEFVQSVHETSAMKWVAYIFLSDEEVEEILDMGSLVQLEEGETSDLDLIEIDEDSVTDEIEIIEISGSSYQGILMIIHDPSRVFVGTVEEFGEIDGQTVADMIETYNANNGTNVIAGINGGDFVDMGSYSYTGQPLGLVISNGEVVYQDSSDNDTAYHITGLTEDNKLVLGNISVNQALEMGIRDAIYTTHDTGPFLIVDGEAMTSEVPDSATYGGGKNPRTAIGQREDGSILLLVVDGRQANSLGATFKDLVQIMQQYGAVNAAAMDGGTSTQMVYEGEILNHPYSAYGPRRCPTAWFVE